MKKSLCLLLFVIFAAVALGGCTQESFPQFSENVSERRVAFFTGENENFRMEASVGERENPFITDGATGKVECYFILTLCPNEVNDVTYAYEVTLSDETFSGTFTRALFGNKQTADLKICPKTLPETLDVRISDGESDVTLTLNNRVTAEMIDWKKALEIATKELKTSIDAMCVEGKLQAEVYVKLIEDSVQSEPAMYWYVAFVDAQKKIAAVLIHPTSGEIVAKRS